MMATYSGSKINLTGRQQSGGAGEQDLLLSVNGAGAAAATAVVEGTRLIINDIDLSCDDVVNFRFQQSNNGGGNWFDLIPLYRLPLVGGANLGRSLGAAIRVDGGANVIVRARIDTPNGDFLVGATLQCGLETLLPNA
jgi:hypothetical protein